MLPPANLRLYMHYSETHLMGLCTLEPSNEHRTKSSMRPGCWASRTTPWTLPTPNLSYRSSASNIYSLPELFLAGLFFVFLAGLAAGLVAAAAGFGFLPPILPRAPFPFCFLSLVFNFFAGAPPSGLSTSSTFSSGSVTSSACMESRFFTENITSTKWFWFDLPTYRPICNCGAGHNDV